MIIFDVILILVLAGFVFYGMFFGLIRTFGAFLGLIVAAILASRFYLEFFGLFERIFGTYSNLGKVVMFIVLFSLINRLVGFLFYLFDRAFNILSIIPFLKTFNRLGGIVLGFFVGSLSIGLILFVISKYTVLETFFGSWLSSSVLAPFFIRIASLLLPVLPDVLKKMHSFI